MIVIANVFPKLETVKDLVRPLSKKPCLRTPFDSQHVKAPQTLLKSAWEHFYHLFHYFEGNRFRKCLSEILWVFVTTLIGDGKYHFGNCETTATNSNAII